MPRPVVDRDEHGQPVTDRYRRLGAGSGSANETGLYVRFEPGFGLNVHIGYRFHRDALDRGPIEDQEKLGLSIQGWERLCELVDEWRQRERHYSDPREGP